MELEYTPLKSDVEDYDNNNLNATSEDINVPIEIENLPVEPVDDLTRPFGSKNVNRRFHLPIKRSDYRNFNKILGINVTE